MSAESTKDIRTAVEAGSSHRPYIRGNSSQNDSANNIVIYFAFGFNLYVQCSRFQACQRMEKFATKDEKGFKMCYAEISAIRESTKNSIREAKESVETQDSRINMLEKLLNAITGI